MTGRLPLPGDLPLEGLDLPAEDLTELFAADPAAWTAEADGTEEYFAGFGRKLPTELTRQLAGLRRRIAAAR